MTFSSRFLVNDGSSTDLSIANDTVLTATGNLVVFPGGEVYHSTGGGDGGVGGGGDAVVH